MKRPFEKTEIKGMILDNRFVRSATWEGLADDEGRVTDRLIDFIAALAEGRAGLIITGFAYVLEEGRAMPFQTGVHKDDLIPDLTRLAEAVHARGGRAAMQIVHAGVQSLVGPAGPSAIELPGSGLVPRDMSISELADIVEAFGLAAGRVRQAGFDAVQLHAAHGYLFSQFLSPFLNKRGDRYGGSISGRARLACEAYEAVRGAVGGDFPVMIKINSEDHVPGGLALEDSIAAARMLADMGLDAVEVSGGMPWSGKNNPARSKLKAETEGYFREPAAAFKDKLNLPVMVVGGIRSLKMAEEVLEKNQADYLSMSRPFIREPDLIARWESGDRSPAACISCNGCFNEVFEGKGIFCSVLAKEREKE